MKEDLASPKVKVDKHLENDYVPIFDKDMNQVSYQETKGFLQTHLDQNGHKVIDASKIANDLKESAVYDAIVRHTNKGKSLNREHPGMIPL